MFVTTARSSCPPMSSRAGDDVSAGAYICSREDLNEFHYQFTAEPFGAGPEHRHGSAWSDSIAFTHCICFGAAARAVEPLLIELHRLRDAVEKVLDDPVRHQIPMALRVELEEAWNDH